MVNYCASLSECRRSRSWPERFGRLPSAADPSAKGPVQPWLQQLGSWPEKAGQLVRSSVQLGRIPQSPLLPVWAAFGRKSGRTMFLSAGIHGDEVNAVSLVQRFVEQLDVSELMGRVLVVPIANVSGFRAHTRRVPEDGKDLNRCFPGDPQGTASDRIAYFIFTELIAAADWGVDVHDSGNGSVLLPHARVHDDELLELGAAFGTEIVMRATLPPGYKGILTVEARKRYRRPFFHVEVGGGSMLCEDFIEQGVVGLRNLLVHEGMLNGKTILPQRQLYLRGRDDLAVPAPIGGFLSRYVELGQRVVKNQKLAAIKDPLTQQAAEIRAEADGIVHDLNMHGVVDAGDDVVGILELETWDSQSVTAPGDEFPGRVNHATNQVIVRPNQLAFP